MIQVSLDEAYQEAILALGESLVRERLLTARLARLEAEHAKNHSTGNGGPAGASPTPLAERVTAASAA